MLDLLIYSEFIINLKKYYNDFSENYFFSEEFGKILIFSHIIFN
jgi:hypothetical protein